MWQIGRLDGTGLQRWFLSLARRSPVDCGGVARIERRHIYILPTATGFLLAAVLVLMLAGSLNYQNNLALLFSFQMVSVAIVGMFHTWRNLLALKVTARGGPPVFAGQEAIFSFSIEDDQMRSRDDLVFCVNDRRSRPIRLGPNGSDFVGISVATVRRGSIKADRVRIETRYPLGLFRAWSYPQNIAEVSVYPRPAASSLASLQTPMQNQSERGDAGIGADDFVGPREYRPGDSLRRLDWKAFARERGLVVKQFGGDRATQVWIDWDRLSGYETEARLSLLCRQVLDAAEHGLSYGLRLPDITLPPDHGEIHKHRCLKSLARFGYG